jgi:hypothetical protein
MSILAFVSDQHSLSRILEHLGLRPSQQDKPPPAREILRVAEAGECGLTSWSVARVRCTQSSTVSGPSLLN